MMFSSGRWSLMVVLFSWFYCSCSIISNSRSSSIADICCKSCTMSSRKVIFHNMEKFICCGLQIVSLKYLCFNIFSLGISISTRGSKGSSHGWYGAGEIPRSPAVGSTRTLTWSGTYIFQLDIPITWRDKLAPSCYLRLYVNSRYFCC